MYKKVNDIHVLQVLYLFNRNLMQSVLMLNLDVDLDPHSAKVKALEPDLSLSLQGLSPSISHTLVTVYNLLRITNEGTTRGAKKLLSSNFVHKCSMYRLEKA